MRGSSFDIVIVGGGLSGGLLAYRLAAARPELTLAVIEKGTALGGNHTWSFHDSDVSDDARGWLSALTSAHWDSQEVRFPKRQRIIETGYNSLFSEDLDRAVSALPALTLVKGQEATALTPTSVTLDSGDTIDARIVFDARGPQGPNALDLGFQKFLGLEIDCGEPHGVTRPIIMDATVPQTDGYRFVYVLPFTPTTMLIEDTYYADGFELPEATLRDEIHSYAARHGWPVQSIIREERGILPITLGGDIDAFWTDLAGGPVPLGLRAGLFHPITGYSVADAVKLTEKLVASPLDNADSTFALVKGHALARWRQHSFYRLLNRMLFHAAQPDQRYIVLERFYGLSHGLIERFYAGESSRADQLRILAGKPPVPIGRAVMAMGKKRTPQPLEEGLLG